MTVMESLGRFLVGTVALILVGANVGTLLGLLAGIGWPAELFSHFPVQYAIAQAAGITFCLALRPRWLGFASLPLLGLNVWLLAPYYFTWNGASAAAPDHDPTLRVMTVNVNVNNRHADLILQAIETEQPDIVAMIEMTPDLWQMLPPEFHRRYPYRASELDVDAFGIALLSRLPFAEHDIYHFGTYGRPVIAARICPQAAEPGEAPRCLHLVAMHADPPVTATLARSRDAQFEEVGEYLRDVQEMRRVVMGDMNVTPWSPVMRDFMEQNRLEDSALGHGIHPTWFSRSLPFGIPIDQILHGDGVVILDRRVGPEIGSDHFPVTADIALVPME
jgi:endonuclease/exonuclease/phosphatase (EEP) superfamily protein YafD